MAGLISPEAGPGSGIVAPPTGPLGIQPAPASKQVAAVPPGGDAPVRQQVDRDEASGRTDPFKVLANFSIGNAIPGGASPITDVDPAFAGAMARMAADMPPDIQQRFRIISGYRSADREQEVNPAVGYGRSEHTNRFAADLAKDPVVLQWITQNGAKYGVGFPLAHDPKEINHLEFMPNGQRMPLARALSMQDAGGTKLRDVWNTPANLPPEVLEQLPPDLRAAFQAQQRAAGPMQERAGELFQQFMKAANAPVAGDKERDEAIAEMRKTSAEMQQEFHQMMTHPPVQKPIDAWANFGSIGTLVGLLGGLFARQHMTAGLNAAGAAMEAINTNNSEQYDRAYKTWQQQSEMGIKMVSMENENIRSLLEDKRMAAAEKETRLATMVHEMGMLKDWAGMSTSTLDGATAYLEKRDLASRTATAMMKGLEYQAASTKIAAGIQNWLALPGNEGKTAADMPPEVRADIINNAIGSVKQAGKPETAGVAREAEIKKQVQIEDDKWASEHPDATPAERATAHFQNYINVSEKMGEATTRPRSPGAAIMDQIKKENPGASAQQIARIYSDVYTRPQAIERAFGSGMSARNLQALNTVADHINSLKQIADAFKTGEVVRVNQLVQRIATETGHPEITNFETARDFLAGEIVRLMTATGGSETDRRNMESHFKAAGSPEQLYGAINVARDFVRGRLNALEQTYARNDPTRRQEFETEMLTEGARTLFGPEGEIAPPVPKDLPSPEGHPDGYVARDAAGKVVARIKDGKWIAP